MSGAMDEKTAFTEDDVLTPEMREQIRAFYDGIDEDLRREEARAK